MTRLLGKSSFTPAGSGSCNGEMPPPTAKGGYSGIPQQRREMAEMPSVFRATAVATVAALSRLVNVELRDKSAAPFLR